MSEALRVRFAPSPTGYLHVGGARTALFNWLWARKNGGVFLLRIEDTDKERSTDANTRSILEGLEWLGLHWDEGPYFQSQGVVRHVEAARRLLAEGKAYRSFATPGELEAQRKEATDAGRPWLRDRASRDLAPEESERRAAAGEPFAIRFKVPEDEGATRFLDRVYGPQERRHRDIEDFALLRPDDSPLYNHVVVCDDVHLRITDVIRGQDHLSNTHKQILLYEALGRKAPSFTHLPLINAPDRTKLSKRRHGEVVSVTTYRDRGFLRTDYEDVEDYSQLHVVFDDGTVADVFATELVLGGVHNWLEVFANNHRTTCRLNPVNLLDTYNPEAQQFRDVYLVEKLGTKEGWSHPAADEEWQQGFYGEIQDFVECCAHGRRPQADADIARDTVAKLYAGYLSAERQGQEVPVPI